MANSYTVLIKFAPSTSTLKQTEKKLNSTFDRVTKRFRTGLAKVGKAFKIGAGVAGMATAIAAILNPMSQLNDRINATLNKASDIKTRAASAGTDIKSYLALSGYAQSKGVSEEALSSALARMQVLVGDAKAGESNALSNYKDETDMGKVFYNVMNEIAKISDPAERAKMASEIFGRQALVGLGPLVTEGFKQEDFSDLLKGKNLGKVQNAVLGLEAKGNEQAKYAVRRDWDDLIAKNGVISSDTIKAQAMSEKMKLERENKQLRSYESVAMIDVSLQKLLSLAQNFVTALEPAMVLLAGALTVISELPQTIATYWGKFQNSLPKWLRSK